MEFIEETACQVCGSDNATIKNAIVYCDGAGCNLGVHQACYGIEKIPKGNWYCEKCLIVAKEARIICELCPNKYGAFKPTDTMKMAHVLCGLYIPEAYFGNVNTMSPIILRYIPRYLYHKECYICKNTGRSEFESVYGVSIKCNVPECTQYFHATCGQAMGLLCEKPTLVQEKVTYCGYCHNHSSQIRENIKFFPAFGPLTHQSPPIVKTKRTSRNSGSTRSRRLKSCCIPIPDEYTISTLPLEYDPFDIGDILKEVENSRSSNKRRSRSLTPNQNRLRSTSRTSIRSGRRSSNRATSQRPQRSRSQGPNASNTSSKFVLPFSTSTEEVKEQPTVNKSVLGNKPRGRPKKQPNQSLELGESGSLSSHTIINSANERTHNPKPEIITSASPEQLDSSHCGEMESECFDMVNVEDNRTGNIHSVGDSRSSIRRRSRSLTTTTIRLRSSSKAATQRDRRSYRRACSAPRSSSQVFHASDTSKFVSLLSDSIEEIEEQPTVNKSVLRKNPSRKPKKEPYQSSLLDESESFSTHTITNFANERALSPIPETITSASSEQPDVSDCEMEIECFDMVNVVDNRTGNIHSDFRKSITEPDAAADDDDDDDDDNSSVKSKANENEICSEAEEKNEIDEVTVVQVDSTYGQTNASNSSLENDDSNSNKSDQDDSDTESKDGSESENSSNQSGSLASYENTSELDSESSDHSARIKSIFDISSAEEDSAREIKKIKKHSASQSEMNFSANSKQPTVDESSNQTEEQSLTATEERLTTYDTATDAKHCLNQAKSSTDSSTTTTHDEISYSNMVNFIAKDTESDKGSSKEDDERNESAVTDCGVPETDDSNATEFSSIDKEDITVTPVIVSTAVPEDTIRKVSLVDADYRLNENMVSDPVNDVADDNLRVEEYVIMNDEEAPSSNPPILVTVPPDNPVMPENNHFVVPNTATVIEMPDKFNNAISTPIDLQTSIMNAKTTDEINSDVQCCNFQETESRTCTNLRKLMNDLTISHNTDNQSISGSVDSFNDNTLDEMPSLTGFSRFNQGFFCSQPDKKFQSQNGSTNYFTDTIKESNQFPPPRCINSNNWTHPKLHPIPKDIPKRDKLLLSRYGEIIRFTSHLFYLKAENDIVEKRVEKLEQKRAALLQRISIEKDLTSAYPSPPSSERHVSVGVIDKEPPKQASNFWNQSGKEIITENNLLSQEQDSEQNDLVYSLYYDFHKSPSPRPISSSIRQDIDEILQNMGTDETNGTCLNKTKKKRNFKKTSKRRRLI